MYGILPKESDGTRQHCTGNEYEEKNKRALDVLLLLLGEPSSIHNCYFFQ
jgi:hypothetical protein